MKNAAGALVDEAQPDTPAAKAGIQAGDVITAVNGNADQGFAHAGARDLRHGAGKLGEARHPAQGRAEEHHRDARDHAEPAGEAGQCRREGQRLEPGTPRLGLSVAPASEVAGAGDKGVVITAVDPDGPAAERGLKSGDVILDVAGKSVGNVAELRSALKDAKSGGKKDVLMRIKTADNTHFVAVPIG